MDHDDALLLEQRVGSKRTEERGPIPEFLAKKRAEQNGQTPGGYRTALLRFHESHGCIVTLTATQPPGRFGALGLDGTRVNSFQEKPQGDGGFINGGFFVLSPDVFGYIDGDDTVWERAPLERLAAERQVQAYIHRGFWHPMDTLRDKRLLEDLWASGNAPWKRW